MESLSSRRARGFLNSAAVRYPLRYDGRQIFYGRTKPIGPVNDPDPETPQTDNRRFHPHERRTAGEGESSNESSSERRAEGEGEARKCDPPADDGHFNPVKGDFCTEIVNTFQEPNVGIMRWWIWYLPFFAAAVAGFIALVQCSCDTWRQLKQAKRRNDIFSSLDKDNTATLDYFELQSGLKRRGFTDDELKAAFATVDKNK